MAFGPQRLNSAHVVVPLTAILGAAVFWRAAHSKPAAAIPVSRTPDAALAELRAGNARFAHSKRKLSTATSNDAERRHELAKGQHPFVAVLCCADSRVCPEFIFD